MRLTSGGRFLVYFTSLLGAVALLTLNAPLLLALAPAFALFCACSTFQPPRINELNFLDKPLQLQRGAAHNLQVEIGYDNGPGPLLLETAWPQQLGQPEKQITSWLENKDKTAYLEKEITAEYTGSADEVLACCRSYSLFPLLLFRSRKTYSLPEISVHPDRRVIERVGETTTSSTIPMPAKARAELGLRTSEFKELREYESGDPYRFINWKATARNITPQGRVPIVNEFEREGRQLVWVYLDTGRGMWHQYAGARRIDYAVEVVIALAKFYLENSCRLGYSTFNNQNKQLLPPESGSKQLHRLTDHLLKLSPSEKPQANQKLKETGRRTRSYYHGSRPLSLVVTYLEESDELEELKRGLRQLVTISGRPRTADGVLCLNLLPSAVGLQEEINSLARNFQKLELQTKLSRLVPGVRQLGWDPGETTVSKLLTAMSRC